MSDLRSFEEFMKQREEVGSAYVQGNAAPLGEIVTQNSPATFFAPMGGVVEGAESIWSRYESDAAHFGAKGESSFEVLHLSAADGLAYWTGFQKARAYFGGSDEPVSMKLRITEIFRFEDGAWKLIHRHADSLTEAQNPSK